MDEFDNLQSVDKPDQKAYQGASYVKLTRYRNLTNFKVRPLVYIQSSYFYNTLNIHKYTTYYNRCQRQK